jgi:hypothetical protein
MELHGKQGSENKKYWLGLADNFVVRIRRRLAVVFIPQGAEKGNAINTKDAKFEIFVWGISCDADITCYVFTGQAC